MAIPPMKIKDKKTLKIVKSEEETNDWISNLKKILNLMKGKGCCGFRK